MDQYTAGFAFYVILISAGLTNYSFKKPIKVSDSHTPVDWFMICVLIMFFFATVFIVESYIIGFLADMQYSEKASERILYDCLDGGALMSLLVFLILCVLGCIVRLYEWDYNKVYSSTFFKLFFTIICISLCIKFLDFTMPSVETNWFAEKFAGRIGAWIIVLIGMWLDFDLPCKDRFELKELDDKMINTVKKCIRFWRELIKSIINGYESNEKKELWLNIKIVFGVIILEFLIFNADKASYKLLKNVYILTGFFVATVFISLIAMKRSYNPRIKQSSRKFKKVFDMYMKTRTKSGTYYFGWMQYYVENDNVIILPLNAEYDSKYLLVDDDLFGEYKIPIEGTDKKEFCLNAMKKHLSEQKARIADAYKKLNDDKKQQKKELYTT